MRPLGWLLTWGSGESAGGGGAFFTTGETWVREITIRGPRSYTRARGGVQIVQFGGRRHDGDPQLDTDHRKGAKG